MAWIGMVVVVAWIAHGDKLQGHWRVDDPALLLHAMVHPQALGDWLSAAQWRRLGVPFFTPALLLDYRIDLALFGLEPRAFYAHHLLVIIGIAVGTGILLQRYTGQTAAWVAAAAFLVGAPVDVVMQQLMARHYAMGLLLAVGSIAVWIRGVEAGRRSLIVASAVLYLLSVLNKEVFAPLPLVLPFLVRQTWKRRLTNLLPLLVAAAFYLGWRAAMLGQVIGGYQSGLGAISDIPGSMFKLLTLMSGPGDWRWLGAALLAVSLACVGGRSARWLGMAGASVAVAMPFAAIHVSLDPVLSRYAFLPWWALCVLVSLAAGRCNGSPGSMSEATGRSFSGWATAILLMAVLWAVAISGTRYAQPFTRSFHEAYDTQSRFLWKYDNDVVFIPFGDVQQALQFQHGTTALKALWSGQSAPRAYPFADAAVALSGQSIIWTLDPKCGCLQPVQFAYPRNPPLTELEVGIDMDRRSSHLFTWRFMTRTDHIQCHLMIEELNIAATVPCQGEVRFGLPAWFRGRMQALARTHDGDWNVTPQLELPGSGERLCWSNKGAC